MPSFSVDGLVSGLDTSNIIAQLMSIERRPIALMERRQTTLNQKMELFQQFNTKLQALKSALEEIGDAENLQNVSVSSSDEDQIKVSADASANEGNFSIEVTALASQSTLISTTGVTDDTAVLADAGISSGQLDITIDGTTTSITYDASTDTLNTIRDAINELNISVSAAVLDVDGDGTDNRLVLTGTEQGADAAVAVSDASGDLVSILGLPSDDGAAGTGTPQQEAADATLELAGVSITRSSNTISDVIDGVTLTLVAVTGSAATIEVLSDSGANLEQVQEFVDAINEVRKFVKGQSKFTEDTSSQPPLFGDTTLIQIDSDVRRALSDRVNGLTDVRSLSQLGITFDLDSGLYEVDSTRVTEWLDENATAVQDFFTALMDTLTQTDGKGRLDRITDTIDGQIKTKADFLQTEIDSLEASIDRMNERLDRRQEALERQFRQLEQTLARLQSQSSFFMAQIGSLPGVTSNRSSGGGLFG
jgi:flagellar hook-associated protein 2